MKLFVEPSDANGDRNPILETGILRHLPLASAMREADAVVVPICYVANYKFNQALWHITKPIILLDFMEFGWDAGDKPNLFGFGSLGNFSHISSEQWIDLDEWVSSLKQPLLFKRELFLKDQNEWRLPIEFPCVQPIPADVSKELFDARPFEVFFNWGLSHPARPRMHGSIFLWADRINVNIIDGWEQYHDHGKVWVTIHTPHYQRRPIEEVLRWQQRAKISISLPGAGVKCFRSAESPIGSVVAKLADELAWAYPWKHMENCVELHEHEGIVRLCNALADPNLYEVYRACQDTIRKYEQRRYVREHVLANIEVRL